MIDRSVTQKPSETALFVALRRALAHLKFPGEHCSSDGMAIHFLPSSFRFFLKFKKVRENTWQKLDAAFPGMNAYLIARTAWFDGLFQAALKDRVPQIVLLGAGYDSRAYRFTAQLLTTKVYELDSAPTQERKKECLKKSRITIPGGVKLIPIDFNAQTLKDVLEKAGWQRQLQTLFIWEGVSMYLQPAAVDQVLSFFKAAASSGSLLAFDFTLTLTDANAGDYFGAREFRISMQRSHPDEGILFALGEGEIAHFLKERGLKLVESMDAAKIERRFLPGEDGTLIGPVSGYFQFALATPE